jgi:hypothetical protein
LENQPSLATLKGKVSPLIFLELCREADLCPECLTESLTITCDDSQEVICKRCGLVISAYQEKQRSLPGMGSDTNYGDTCSLSFGKSLGSELGKYQMFSVLAKNGKTDLGKRRLIIKNVTRVEIPQVQQMLFYGSQLCRKYGFDGKDQKSITFADELGRILRLVGSVMLALSRDTIRSKQITNTCFYYLYRKCSDDGDKLQEDLKIKEEELTWLDWVLSSYSLPRRFYSRKKTCTVVS